MGPARKIYRGQGETMNEDDTYLKLKRIIFEEMCNVVDEDVKSQFAPLYNLNGTLIDSRKHEITRFHELTKLLVNNGWTIEEFALESEKRVILDAIKAYNVNTSFPNELVLRAQEYFPNAKFYPARIELE